MASRGRRCGLRRLAPLLALAPATWLVSCQEVDVQPQVDSETLCEDFYQACINPILVQPLPLIGSSAELACSAQGCHDIQSGSGGAFKLASDATAGSPKMTANYVSSRAFANIADPSMSKILLEPLAGSDPSVGGHSGGDIFADPNDPHYQELLYWISHPQQSSSEACPQLDHYPGDAARRCLADLGP